MKLKCLLRKIGKFNIPNENTGSFTVNVEDSLAEVWQLCLEKVYGKPKLTINPQGTECDRVWKTVYDQCELTVHFYNHNKPKDKKQSKILIQGAIQTRICEFVLTELPKIYKDVCENKMCAVTPLRQQKRKRITTTVKKAQRNIKYKASLRHEGPN